MKRLIAFALLLNAALLGVIAWQLVIDDHNTDRQAYAADKDEILKHMSIVELPIDDKGRKAKTIRFSGVNVQVVNGTGKTGNKRGNTEELNGIGNLIVGYQETRESGNDRSGSHNLVVGSKNNYSIWGGQVVGDNNTISGNLSSVSGGSNNTASGFRSVVSGGSNNTAGGGWSTIGGGFRNSIVKSVSWSTVSGGVDNKVSGERSTVGGGGNNSATGLNSTVSGGAYNTASGESSTVGGGGRGSPSIEQRNRELRKGRYGNIASGPFSTVSGGKKNKASGETSTVSGGQYNTASAYVSTVSGGGANWASGIGSTVSGGADLEATAMDQHLPLTPK